jgi:hypothetical protein
MLKMATLSIMLKQKKALLRRFVGTMATTNYELAAMKASMQSHKSADFGARNANGQSIYGCDMY